MRQQAVEHREVWARRLLWLAVCAPWIYSTAKTAADIQSSSIGPLEVVRGGGTIALLVVAGLIARPPRRTIGAVEIGLGAFCLAALASTAWSVDPLATALKAASLAAIYVALLQLLQHYPTPRDALTGLATAVHWLLLITAFEAALFPTLVYSSQKIGTPARLGTLVPQVSANPLAYVAFAGVLATILKIGPTWITRSGPLRLSLVALYLAELVACRTRSALGIAIICVFFSLITQIRRRPMLVTGTLLAGAAAAIWVLSTGSDTIRNYLLRGQNQQGIDSLTGRTYVWRLALEAWEPHKLEGLGYFAGHRIGLGLQAQSNLDSTWIESLVDVGLLGTIPLALAVTAGMWRIGITKNLGVDLKLWTAILAVYGVSASFVNPTVQSPGAGMLLLGFLLFSSYSETDECPHARAAGRTSNDVHLHSSNDIGSRKAC